MGGKSEAHSQGRACSICLGQRRDNDKCPWSLECGATDDMLPPVLGVIFVT